MRSDERRDAMSEGLRERFRDGFLRPEVGAGDRRRLLADARLRSPEVPRVQLRPTARVLLAALVAAVALVALFALRPLAPSADKDLIVQRAMAAIAQPGGITHVVAVTEFDYGPPPPAPKLDPTPKRGPDGRLRHRHGGHPITPSLRTLKTEHWVATDASTRRSISDGLFANSDGKDWFRTRAEIGDRGGRTIKIYGTTDASHAMTSTAWEYDAADPLPQMPGGDLPDYRSLTPQQKLRDTSDPSIYHELLSSTLAPPLGADGKPYAESHTRVSLLGEGTLDGVPVYRLRILYTERLVGADTANETSLVAQVRQSDYTPLRVDGSEWYLVDGKAPVPQGPTWVTRYLTVETLQKDSHADVLQVTVPAGVKVRTNMRLAPDKVAAEVRYPVSWVGAWLGDLRFVGYFRLLQDTDSEYEMMRNPSSASVTADEQRPKVGTDFTVAEYTRDGEPGNLSKLAEPVLKVISLPRIDPNQWQAISNAVPAFSGSTTKATTRLTTVAGRKALVIHRGAVASPDPPTSPNAGITIDYVFVDMGDSTVLLQGANTGYKLLEQAATSLVPAR